ncbi:MAG: hypothetical protein ABI402_19550 [Ferruginibacter sp.]
MAATNTIYLVQGGLNLTEDSKPDFDFFIITYDFKKNYGYIGRKGKNSWKLYTILGRTPMVLGSPDNHYHFKNFEDCVKHLKKLSNAEVQICYIETEDEAIPSSADLRPIGGGNLYGSEKTIEELIATNNLTLTPGAEYKLELYVEFLKRPATVTFSDFVHNGMTFHLMTERHKHRIKALEDQLEVERKLIRPEDIPDFDIE